MCRACWEQGGRPVVTTAAERVAARAIAHLREIRPGGGNLWLFVREFNCDRWAFGLGEKLWGDNACGSSPEALEREQRCLAVCRGLTESQRLAAVAEAWGFNRE